MNYRNPAMAYSNFMKLTTALNRDIEIPKSPNLANFKFIKPDLWSFEGCHRQLWSALYFVVSMHASLSKLIFELIIFPNDQVQFRIFIMNETRSFIDGHKSFSLKFLGIGVLSYLSYKSIHEFRMLSSKSNNKMELLLARDSAAQVRFVSWFFILFIY